MTSSGGSLAMQRELREKEMDIAPLLAWWQHLWPKSDKEREGNSLKVELVVGHG